MNEQLISFETTKLAKEKGFFDKYSINNDLWLTLNYEKIKNMVDLPTQSLLQKWLREEHEIYLCPIWDSYSFDNKKMLGYKCRLFTWEEGENNTLVYNTYEEALEEGLKKALELIK